MNFVLPIRELIVKNFKITLKSIEINDYRLYNSYYLYFFRIIPFFIIKLFFFLFHIKYIYLLDNIYFSNYGKFKFYPTLLGVNVFIDDDKDKINITNNILKYNGTVPIWYIIENENLYSFKKIEFKYFLKNKIETNIFNLHEINNNLLYDIL
jgi:hypothetical protein